MENQNNAKSAHDGPSLSNLYRSMLQVRESLLSTQTLGQQPKPTNQSFTPYRQPNPLQIGINPLDAYIRSVQQLVSPIGQLQAMSPYVSVHENTTPAKLDLYKQEIKPAQEKEGFKPKHKEQPKEDFANVPVKLKKQEAPVTNELQRQTSQPDSGNRKKKSYWLPQEDEQLLSLMKIHGEKWTKIASCLQGRTGKQARDRYINYLKPSIQQKSWTEEEMQLLDQLSQEFGNKWSKIADRLPGRTENQVKNKFYSGVRQGKFLLRKDGVSSDEKDMQELKLVKMDSNFESELAIKAENGDSTAISPTRNNEEVKVSSLLQDSAQVQQYEQNNQDQCALLKDGGIPFNEPLAKHESDCPSVSQLSLKDTCASSKEFTISSNLSEVSEEIKCSPYKKVKLEVEIEAQDKTAEDIKPRSLIINCACF